MSGSLKTLVPQAGSRTEYACIAFDGPGQGAAVIKEGLVFRPDREAVAEPVIDFAETPPKVDATRVRLMGVSLAVACAARRKPGILQGPTFISSAGQHSSI